MTAMKKGKIFIISGPSGSGKTTLYKKLLTGRKFQGKLVKTVSATTRPMRSGERCGRDYLFISPRMFFYKKKAGHFLESQKVFDHYYATPKNQVRRFLRAGKWVLLCIDVEGAKTVCRRFPEAVKIFIKTSSPDVLKRRLEQRGSEDTARIRLRLKRARRELKEAASYDYIVVNDSLKDAYRDLEGIISAEMAPGCNL